MNARTQAWIDQQNAHLAAAVRRHGWAIQYVGGDTCSSPGCRCPRDDGPPFAYTIGLFGLDHPELLIFGVDTHTAGGVLNELGSRIRSGTTLLPGRIITAGSWPHRIIPEPVPNPGEIVLGSNQFYRRPPKHSVPALQLSYADTAGRFPWEEGCLTKALQPRPGLFTA